MNIVKSSKSVVGAFVFATGFFVASAPASAAFTFSDVTFTTNSITFTIDGDMVGHVDPNSQSDQFSIRMLGDIYSGPASGYTPNIWSRSPFDNKTFQGGNLYNSTNTVPYSWNRFDSSLASAVASSVTATVSWSENWLNASALDTRLEFVWGNGHDDSRKTVMATYRARAGAVPEPATLAFLGFGLAALGFARRRKQSA